jgi:hypothetical protein
MKICGSESWEVTGRWIKLHLEDFDESRCLSNNINKMLYRVMRCAEECNVRRKGEKFRHV